MARPTDYTLELLEKAQNYLTSCEALNQLPSIAGLSLYIDIARSTVYLWAADHPEFSDILEKILSTQEVLLIDGGIKGSFNSTITKLMLTKHGYSDKQELLGKDGEALNVGVVMLPVKNNENTMGTATETISNTLTN